jgi:hypothetical protein
VNVEKNRIPDKTIQRHILTEYHSVVESEELVSKTAQKLSQNETKEHDSRGKDEIVETQM